MNISTLRDYLDDPDAAAQRLRSLGIVDVRRADWSGKLKSPRREAVL